MHSWEVGLDVAVMLVSTSIDLLPADHHQTAELAIQCSHLDLGAEGYSGDLIGHVLIEFCM